MLGGQGNLELSAFRIHVPLHRITGAKVILHMHQTWVLALNMLEDNRAITMQPDSGYFHKAYCV